MGGALPGPLPLTKADGTSAGSIPPGQTVGTNTLALTTPRDFAGTARFTHDGPPGAFVVEAAVANFSLTPTYVQPVKFFPPRKGR